MKLLGGLFFSLAGILCLSAGVYLIYHVWQVDQNSHSISDTIISSWPYLLMFGLVCLLIYDISKKRT